MEMDERLDVTELDTPEIHDDMDAEEHLRKIRYWKSYEERMLAHFERQIQAVKEKTKSHIEWHEHLLQSYFAKVPHSGTKTQETYSLPSGKMVMKRATDSLVRPEKENETAFLLYLAESGIKEYTKTKITEALDWANYKKRLTIVDGKAVDKETGEIVEEIRVEHVEPKFSITLNDEEGEHNDGAENSVA